MNSKARINAVAPGVSLVAKCLLLPARLHELACILRDTPSNGTRVVSLLHPSALYNRSETETAYMFMSPLQHQISRHADIKSQAAT